MEKEILSGGKKKDNWGEGRKDKMSSKRHCWFIFYFPYSRIVVIGARLRFFRLERSSFSYELVLNFTSISLVLPFVYDFDIFCWVFMNA